MDLKAERANWPVTRVRLGKEETNRYAVMSPEERVAAAWALTCEEDGIDPDNPPPMRKDVFRIGRLRDQ
jgi:hypothetical protein